MAMRMKILCVRDRSADVFGTPYFSLSIGAAARAFADEINRVADNNVMHKHPEDFDLYELGEYSDETGTMDTFTPRQVCVGKDMIRER